LVVGSGGGGGSNATTPIKGSGNGNGNGTSGEVPGTTKESDSKESLAWWEILLMVLGCAFIFVVFIWCWRRRARKQRAKRTKEFAAAKNIDPTRNWGWRRRLAGFFAGRRGKRRFQEHPPTIQLVERYHDDVGDEVKLRDIEEARERRDREKLELIGAYEYSSRSSSSSSSRRSRRAPEPLPSLHERPKHSPQHSSRGEEDSFSRIYRTSVYSEMTGVPRHAPEPRQPIRDRDLLGVDDNRLSQASASSISSYSARTREGILVPLGDTMTSSSSYAPTPAQEYARAVKPNLLSSVSDGRGQGGYWMQPMRTGTSSASRGTNNPFLR